MTVPQGVEAKLERAQQHLETLRGLIDEFMATYPYEVGRTIEDGGRRHIYRFNKYEPTPTTVSVVIGDCVHNIRSALDHTVFSLATSGAKAQGNSLSDIEERSVQFPVSLTENDFNTQLSRGRLPQVDPKAIDYIRRVQPFRVKDPDHHPLAAVSKLDNIDKHRELSVIASSVNIHIEVPEDVPQPVKDLSFDHWELGGHVVTFTFPRVSRSLI